MFFKAESHCILPGWTFFFFLNKAAKKAMSASSDTFSNRARQKSKRENLGFLGLPGKTNHPLLGAPLTCLCPGLESYAGNDETETNVFWQRAVNLWKTNFYITAEALMRLFVGIFGSRANWLQCLHSQTSQSNRNPVTPIWVSEAAAHVCPFSSCRHVAFY